MKVVEHLEKYIGEISRGADIVDKRYDLSISLYNNIPFEGVKTYSTLGMNHYFIDYYYEFIFVCGNQFNGNEIVSFLTSLSEYLIDSKNGVRRGDILSFDFTITSETKMNSLYFSLPFYFDDDLQELKLEDKSVIFPLIIPIYSSEAVLIEKNGWEKFEEFLEDNEIDDLWDFNRNEFSW
nr:suppressor of fused domain protein [uncultured Chryseobacterium sp.]